MSHGEWLIGEQNRLGFFFFSVMAGISRAFSGGEGGGVVVNKMLNDSHQQTVLEESGICMKHQFVHLFHLC